MSAPIRRGEWRGEEAIFLEDGRLAAVILPARGGKVASLRDLATGRHILDEGSAAAFPPLDPERPYGAEDSSGFDDMFPSISPGRLGSGPDPELRVPDHGEAWRLPWHAEEARSSDASALRLRLDGRILPYTLTKTLRLGASGDLSRLGIEYELENRGGESFEWMWAAHPLFAVGPLARFRLAGGSAGAAVINSYDNPAMPGFGRRYSFPIADFPDGSVRRIDEMPVPEAGRDSKLAFKYWFAERRGGAQRVIVDDPSSPLLVVLEFDGAQAPHLGVWLNAGALFGQRNLALEPASAPMDSPEAARRLGFAVPRLDPGQTARWRLAIVVAPR